MQFTIPGKPVAKQRHRTTKRGHTYTPAKTVQFEQQVKLIAMQHFKAPLTGPVKLTVVAIFEPPPSWSKRKTEATMFTPHIQRPDLDNIVKAIKDGLNRIAWVDDSQVAETEAKKAWGRHAATHVWVEPIGAR